jgi:hypothetical protein
LPATARHTDADKVRERERERARGESNADDGRRRRRVWGTDHCWIRRPRPDIGRPRDSSGTRRSEKDGRFGGGEEKMTWHGGTHELGRRIRKLPEQLVFYG